MFDSNATPNTASALVAAPAPGADQARRKALFAGLAAVVLIGATGYGAYYALVGAHYVETDNAYVAADTAQVTPLVGGPVRSVAVRDTQAVKRGQVLVVLDDTDARIALASAQAELARAERRVRGYLATDQGLTAQIAARAADETRAASASASAKADLERARLDLERRQPLAVTGAVSGEELTRAQNALANAQAAYASARAAQVQAQATRAAAASSLAASITLTDGTTVQTNPEVAAARARVDQARVDLERTVVRAPIDGVVARRNVQIGQKVAPGAALMQIVPVQQAYVDANFKEGQLRKVQIGQPVELEADLYGGAVKYHGTVVGLSGGTGSSFALIPAQNATGNWIKVVQRLPVRVAIAPTDLEHHPLRLGLSMKAVIDTRR